MVFSSTVFLFLFLPVVIAVYYNPFVKKRGFRNIVLLLASLFFYGWGEPVFVFLMILSIIVNWAFGLMVDGMAKKGNKLGMKLGMILSVVYNLGLMFVFKYLTFVTKNISYLLHNDSIVVNIALPIGISFFTFQLMSYVFDVYYGTAKVQKNLLYVGLYVSMFPQLIAGPIVRYETVADEIVNRVENRKDSHFQLCRENRGYCICHRGRYVRCDGMAWRDSLYLADLLRFFRIFGYGNRAWKDVRLPFP